MYVSVNHVAGSSCVTDLPHPFDNMLPKVKDLNCFLSNFSQSTLEIQFPDSQIYLIKVTSRT